jgi:hypothetical protein
MRADKAKFLADVKERWALRHSGRPCIS